MIYALINGAQFQNVILVFVLPSIAVISPVTRIYVSE